MVRISCDPESFIMEMIVQSAKNIPTVFRLAKTGHINSLDFKKKAYRMGTDLFFNTNSRLASKFYHE